MKTSKNRSHSSFAATISARLTLSNQNRLCRALYQLATSGRATQVFAERNRSTSYPDSSSYLESCSVLFSINLRFSQILRMEIVIIDLKGFYVFSTMPDYGTWSLLASN
jgi:hypothetical protein